MSRFLLSTIFVCLLMFVSLAYGGLYEQCMDAAETAYLGCYQSEFEACAPECSIGNLWDSCVVALGLDPDTCVNNCLYDTGLGAFCDSYAESICYSQLTASQIECYDLYIESPPATGDCGDPTHGL